MAEPLQDKGKGKEVPSDVPAHERPQSWEEVERLQHLTKTQNGDLDALKTRTTRQAEQIATLTRENGELRVETTNYMADVERQGRVQGEEREQMESAARTLEQRLNAQIQKATRYEERLILERPQRET